MIRAAILQLRTVAVCRVLSPVERQLGARLVSTRGSSRYAEPLYEKPSGETEVKVIPVADLEETSERRQYGVAETIVRNKLASLYRVIDLAGWADGIYGHASVRIWAVWKFEARFFRKLGEMAL